MGLTASKSPTIAPNGTEKYPFLIELTAKRWKGLFLIAFTLGFAGLFLFFWQLWVIVYRQLMESGYNIETSSVQVFTQIFTNFFGIVACLLLLASLIIGCYAKFMAWWRHG